MKITCKLLISLIFLIASARLHAQEVQGDTLRKWYVPTYARVQFAGNLGMFSAGPGWTFSKRHLALEPSIGFVPRINGQKAIYNLGIKGLLRPGLDIKIKNTIIKPLALGIGAYHTIGTRFGRYQDTQKYPKRYYWWNPQLRVGFMYQAEVYTNLNFKRVKGISLYLEASTWDIDLFSYLGNGNRSYLTLWDITTFGLGTRIFFY